MILELWLDTQFCLSELLVGTIKLTVIGLSPVEHEHARGKPMLMNMIGKYWSLISSMVN